MNSLKQRAGAATAALALIVAACGGGASPSPSAPAESQPPVASPAESTPLTGELTVWAMGEEGTNLPKLAEDFEAQNPAVSVRVTPIDWGAAHDKLLTAIAARQTPDVSQIGTTWMGEFSQTGAFDEVPGGFDTSGFFEGARNTAVIDGKAYGVPWYVETRLIYYRTDIAEKAGITAPPKNWDELKAMAKAMREKGDAKYGINLQPGGEGSWQTYLPFVWSNGGDVVGADGQFALNSPEAVEALTFYQSFFKEGLSPTEATELVPDFKAGQQAMFISGPWFIDILKEQAPELEGKWGLALMPTKKSATSFVGGSNLAVFKDSKNRELAWKFVEFLSDPATQVKWYGIASALPAVKSAWDDASLKVDERIVMFGQQLNDAKSPPAFPKWEEVAAAIDDQVAQATVGSASAQTAADAMQQKAEGIGTGL